VDLTSEDQVVILDRDRIIDLRRCPGTCGPRNWCPECRMEIRYEALRWLRELNVLPHERPRNDRTVVDHVWSPELMLADQ
jgi:hypothetical protein